MDNTKIDDLKNAGYFVGTVDGANCPDLKSAIANIAKAFKFPDYYGENIDAFHECINDLDWLPESNYALVMQHSDLFMIADTDGKAWFINLLVKVTEDWANVPNFENEDTFRQKADFKVIYT